MTLILDVPLVVNEEAERISTHGGMASIDFNGAEKERREAMRLVAQTQEMAKALRGVLERPQDELTEAHEDEIRAVLRAAGVEVT